MIWFTSNWHIGHSNIIRYTNRPFDNVRHMNETILDKYIGLIQEEDEVYFIGNVFWGHDFEWQKATYDLLPGCKYLIFGNHDNRRECRKIFGRTYSKFKLEEFTLIHNPYTDHRESKLCICGHAHEKFRIRESMINVSVEVWDYQPVPLTEIRRIAARM